MPKLRIVGAGTPNPTPSRWGTCFILEICGQRLMIDCGPASTYKMYKMGIPSTSISNLNVYGPSPIKKITETIWSAHGGVFWFDVEARINHPMSIHAFHTRGGKGDRPPPQVKVTEYTEGKVAEGEGWVCYAREVKHAQPYIACYGFRFETDEGIVAFSGDTAPTGSVVELARSADLFVMEAVHREEKIQTFPSVISESGTLSAGRMAAEAGAKRLVINHQSPTLDPPEETTQGISEVKSVYNGPLYWAHDMMDISW